jgi:hypothetical protein
MPERVVYEPPPDLPESMPRRDLRGDARFDSPAGFESIRAPAAAPVRPRIVSSAHGSIDHVMIWYPNETGSLRPYRAVYGDLLRELPARTRVTMVVHPGSQADAEELAGAREGVEIVTTPDFLAFSVWAEDACVVVEDLDASPPVTYLVEPYEFPRTGDQIVADLVAQSSEPIQATQLPLMFQGGNILIGDTFVLIGRDYLDESVDRALATGSIEGFPLGAPRAEQEKFVADLFRRTFDEEREVHFLESDPTGRPGDSLVQIGGEVWLEQVTAGLGARQPIFHIDMFVSLVGRERDGAPYRVLVGDPGAADELLGWEPVDHALQGEFDAVADQLAGLGFEVGRSPLPYLPAAVRRPGQVTLPDGSIQQIAGRRRWYHATSNNCLVQIDASGREVWLPTYGHGGTAALQVTDTRHRELWQELGFGVHELGDFNAFAFNLGALHCIKKYLARGSGG